MDNVHRVLDLLNQASDGETKKAKRYEAIEQVFLHFNDEETRQELTSSEDWLDAVGLTANIMITEFEEHSYRADDNRRSSTACKIRGFELFHAFILEQCNGAHDSVVFADFIVPLTTCFSKVFAIRTLFKDAWAMAIELILSVLKQYSIVDLEYLQFKTFWEELTKATKASLIDTTTFSRNDRRTLLSIIAEITPTLVASHCFSMMPEIIIQLSDLAVMFSWDSKDNAKTPFLEILNHLVATTADRHRALLLEQIFPTVYKHILPHLKIIAPNESRNFRAYTSPIKSKNQLATTSAFKEEQELPESGFSSQVYKLITNVIILAYPDCELNSNNFKPAFDIVDVVIRDRIETEIAEKDNKLGVTRTRFVLPLAKIPLLARAALLGHLHAQSSDESQSEPLAKRKKISESNVDLLVDLVQSRLYPRWQILLMIVTQWRHRLTDADLDAIADALIDVEQSRLKKDESLDLLLQICSVVFSEKRNVDLPKHSALWKSAVSLIPGALTRDSACSLVAAMAPYVTSVLSIKPNDILSVVFFQIAQLTVYSSSVIHLIHVILTSFDFDEHTSLRADFGQSVYPEWKFRMQLLYSILSYANPHCDRVWGLLRCLISYNPCHFPVEPLPLPTVTASPIFEQLLIRQFCKQQQSIASRNKKPVVLRNPKNECIAALVLRLVDYLNQHFELAIEDRSRRIFLWKMCIFAVAEYSNDEFKRLLEAFEAAFAEDFGSACSQGQIGEITEVFSTMQIGRYWKYSGDHLKHVIKTLADEFDDVAAHKLAFFWEPYTISKWILDDKTVAQSPMFEQVIRDNLDGFILNDILLLFETFSTDLTSNISNALLERALNEIRATAVSMLNPAVIQSMTEQLIYSALRYIDLASFHLSEDVKTALRNCDTVFVHAIDALPLNQLNSDDIAVIAAPLNPIQTCRLLEAYLDVSASLIIPTVVLKTILKHDVSVFIEFVPHFEEYLDYWGPSLIYWAFVEKNYHSSWKKKWQKWNNSTVIQLLIRGDAAAINETLSPEIFFIHPDVFAAFMAQHPELIQRLFEQPLTVKLTMCALRKAVFKLRQSRNYLKFNYAYHALNVIVTILKVENIMNSVISQNHAISGDIAALVTALACDAIEMTTETLLAPLLIEFFAVLPHCGLDVLKVLVIADWLFKSKKFNATIAKLAESDTTDSRFYWNHVLSEYSADSIPNYVAEDVQRFLRSTYFELDEFATQLTAFWLELRRQLQKDEKHRNETVLNMILQFWMFYPRLRPYIVDVCIMFPDEMTRTALRDYQKFAYFVPDRSRPNSTTSSVNDEKFASRVMFALLFDAVTIAEPSVTQALYDLWLTQDGVTPQYPREPDITDGNRAGLILYHCRSFQPTQQAFQDCLLRIAYVMPLVASLWLSRGHRQSQFMKACGKASDDFIPLFNETFKTLLIEEIEQQKYSSSSSYSESAATAFTFDFSQIVSAPPPQLSRENSVDTATGNNAIFGNDSTVMFLFAAMKVLQEQFNHLHKWDLRSLCQCLVNAKLFDEAHYVMKLIVDRVEPNKHRCMYAFKSKTSILNASDDASLVNLMAEILIGRRDHEALAQLPLTVRGGARARLLMAEAKKDWIALTDVATSLGDKQSEAKALLFVGGQAADSAALDVRFEAYVRRSQWDADAPGYPKRANSHWKQVYTILKRHHDGLPYGTEHFLTDLLNSLTLNTLVSVDALHKYRQLSLLACLSASKASEIMPSADSSLHAAFSLADLSAAATLELPLSRLHAKVEAVIDAVTLEAARLRTIGAPIPALKLLDTLHSVYNNPQLKGLLISGSTVHVNPATVCDMKVLVERAITLKAAGDTDMAIWCAELATIATGQTFLPIKNEKRRAIAVAQGLQLLAELSPTAKPALLLRQAISTVAECDATLRSKAHSALARTHESEYYSLQMFTESAAYKLKKEVVSGFQCGINGKDRKSQHIVNLEVQAEEVSIQLVERRKKTALHECMKHYLKAVALSTSDETIVYRMVALIIANTNDNDLMDVVLERLPFIPSFIWLPVLKILASYLFSDALPVQRVVDAIAFTTTIEYPFHAVPHLLFYHSDATQGLNGTKPRNIILEELFIRCNQQKPELKTLLSYMTCSHRYFNALGVADFKDTNLFKHCGNRNFQMTENLSLIKHAAKLKGSVIVPTANQPLFPPKDPRNYKLSMFVTIKEIHTECTIAEGLSNPKTIEITGSDGKRYRMLLKKEDIRQDSLVQQLFALGNILLSQNPFPGAPKVPLRRYVVLPLSAEAGIIEWCEGTTSLCAYLIGNDRKSGAHARYHPNDLTGMMARQRLGTVCTGAEAKETLFRDVCSKFNPVFRHFFFERFTNAKDYLAAIERYTISLAQWSIMCYIVGLGDRHLNNILIDESAGEFIHIDLGMIFEYSKRSLPIPENIPFRLTRDIVDPLLTDGINGRLRSVAVHTLQVFRENADVIIGIASTLIHDPVSTFAIVARQMPGSTEQQPRHLVAEAAISRLREKLAGRDLDLREMPADRQVDRLFCDALNQQYLAHIFNGWMPCV